MSAATLFELMDLYAAWAAEQDGAVVPFVEWCAWVGEPWEVQ